MISVNKRATLNIGYNFLNLVKFEIKSIKITKLEKKLFDRFPMLQSLIIAYNKELRLIDNGTFSSLTNLVYLNLYNNRIEAIKQRQFSGLIN